MDLPFFQGTVWWDVLDKEKHREKKDFDYQHLQRSAKWFLKGVNSPSLMV